MDMFPKKIISSVSDIYGKSYIQYDEITFEKFMCDLFRTLKILDFKIETLDDFGKLTLKVSKDSLKEYFDKQYSKALDQVYLEKCISLTDRIGSKAVEYLCKLRIDLDIFDKFVDYLPEKELIEKDIYIDYKAHCYASYSGVDEKLYSIEIPLLLAQGKSIDEIPEHLKYHYHSYGTAQIIELEGESFISTQKKELDAPFTKTELLESIKKVKEGKQKLRKK